VATLHVVCGKAGAGKTTFARGLGRELPALMICEDEWLARLAAPIETLDDYIEAATKCRSVIAPLTVDLLRLGTSVVFDFARNTVRDRKWAFDIAQRADVDGVLHYLPAVDETCKARIEARNETKPKGIYFGHVTESHFDAVTRYFQEPAPDEGFRLVVHDHDSRR
jgi:predicted kinase